jgi:hypothetical protein
VKFDKERAEDFDGVTKEVFSTFWEEFNAKFMKGSRYRSFHIAPSLLSNADDLKAYGRILEHGFKLTKYLPTFFNSAQLFMIVTGKEPSDELVLKGFLSCVSMQDKDLIEKALGALSFDQSLVSKLMDILCCYGLIGLPNAQTKM